MERLSCRRAEQEVDERHYLYLGWSSMVVFGDSDGLVLKKDYRLEPRGFDGSITD